MVKNTANDTLVIVFAHRATLAAIQFNSNSDKPWYKHDVDTVAGKPFLLSSVECSCISQFCEKLFLGSNVIFIRHGQTASDDVIQSPDDPLLESEKIRLINVFADPNFLGISYDKKRPKSV